MKQPPWQLLREIGAERIPHSGRTLYDHLTGTYALLRRWESSPSTCRAGLFHSVYGTQTFDVSLMDLAQRHRLREAIGPRAERLVFIFAICDRDDFFDELGIGVRRLKRSAGTRRISTAQTTLGALVEIEVANMLEQIPYKGRIAKPVMRVYARQCARAKAVLPPLASRHATQVFRRYEQRYGQDS